MLQLPEHTVLCILLMNSIGLTDFVGSKFLHAIQNGSISYAAAVYRAFMASVVALHYGYGLQRPQG